MLIGIQINYITFEPTSFLPKAWPSSPTPTFVPSPRQNLDSPWCLHNLKSSEWQINVVPNTVNNTLQRALFQHAIFFLSLISFVFGIFKFNSLHTEDLDFADGYSYFIIAGLLSLDWQNFLVSLQVTMPIVIWSATLLLPIAHWLFKMFSPGIYGRYRQARRLQAKALWKIIEGLRRDSGRCRGWRRSCGRRGCRRKNWRADAIEERRREDRIKCLMPRWRMDFGRGS